MSLHKKLWLAIVVLLVAVFATSLLVTTLSARAYLEEQLAIKNSDNAAALALSLTQQGADPVLMELTLAAQFDTGFYELIQLTDPEGNVMLRRADDSPDGGAPGWFIRLFPIDVAAGTASVQAGWQQAGALTLRSHSHFAYEELWTSSLTLAAVFLLAGIAAGAAGSAALRRILRPLGDVVAQAEAIGNRRFISIREPKTLEFRRLVSAMNALSARVRQMLEAEGERLQGWQRESSVDAVTGLQARGHFLRSLRATLERDDAGTEGSLAMLRITGLARLNQDYGRGAIDNLLGDMGTALNALATDREGWAVARLNGSDFAVLAPGETESADVARAAQDAMRDVLRDHALDDATALPGAATPYGADDRVGELLGRLDGVLLGVQREGESRIGVASRGDKTSKPMHEQLEYWRETLGDALRSHAFSLAYFPVVDRNGGIFHREGLVRLARPDGTVPAGQFLPWVHRLHLAGELDREVVALALADIADADLPVAINLSAGAVTDPAFGDWLEEQLAPLAAARTNLCVEIPETLAFQHLANFKYLCARLQARGCCVGIKHVGHQLAELGNLHDVGLDYLKVDASFIGDIDTNAGNQMLLRALCTLGHAIGVKVIAAGVAGEEEWVALLALGIDGATGPGVRPAT
ncbi:MAG: EAL domain-containing protein [Halioglobus sp.]|nr:EAL domain-containing protein [Halioglobus sp.]